MNYIERYRAGEHAAVWEELTDLGDRVRTRTVKDDAIAVARETMRRASKNIETIAARLREEGYQFRDPKPFVPATSRTPDHIKTLEKALKGRLPLSLAAWWEQIGEVSLLGRPSKLADPLVFAPITFALEQLESWSPEPPYFPPPEAWQTSIEAWRRSLLAEGRTPQEIQETLAPAIAEFQAEDIENEQLRALPFDPRFRFQFAPDELTKAEVKGGTCDVLLPSPTADFILEGAPGDPFFVDYLRQAFLESKTLANGLLPL